ncbi:endothelin-converting enzyme homolog [Tachypleus tridentatus]|uniref:endothelin-converting enzyme homolog n=1 Tax=Tachypleus tridentatus TaxID=6853 RepID=UPI003FD11940
MADKRNDEEKADPNENDKCIGNNKDEEKKRKSWKEFCVANMKVLLVIISLCVLLFIVFVVMLVFAVKLKRLQEPGPSRCLNSGCLKVAADAIARMDTSYDPCTNFWAYSCGNWIKTHNLTDDKGSRKVEDVMRDHIFHQLRYLIDLVPSSGNERTPEWKVKRFFTSCMKTVDIEYSSFNNFKNKVNELGGWNIIPDTWSLQRWDVDKLVERLHKNYGIDAFFKISVDIDDINPQIVIIKMEPAGLGLPDPSYYQQSNLEQIIKAYKDLMQGMAKEYGATPEHAKQFSEDTFQFEKRMAKIMPSVELLLNPEESYKKMTVDTLKSLAPKIKWLDLLQAYFPFAEISVDTEVAIVHPQYFRDLSDLLIAKGIEEINNYLMWRLLSHYADHLPSRFRNLKNKFRRFLEGVEDQDVPFEERWHFCIRQTNRYLGLALGSMYVKKYFSPALKLQGRTVVNAIKDTFVEEMGDISWLDATSQKVAKEKILSSPVLIGYPDLILNENDMIDYHVELVVQTEYLENIFAGEYFLREKKKDLLISSPDPEHSWTLIPQSVDAVYKYSGNQLIVPAGLLTSYLLEAEKPLAWRYGALGTKTAKQMLRAFDEKGIHYKTNGQLESWMTNSSLKAYKDKIDCLEDHISTMSYENVKINSEWLGGKALTDIGSVKLAYQAYRRQVTDNTLLFPGVGNSDSLFFISYAQSMCELVKMKKVENLKNVLHSVPNKIRVMTTLQQLPEFSKTFGCDTGSEMNLRNTCPVW